MVRRKMEPRRRPKETATDDDDQFSSKNDDEVKQEISDIQLNRKNDLEQEISDHIKEFSLDNNEDQCNMVIRCEDGQVSAHIQILALYSNLFRNMWHAEEDLVFYVLDYKCENVRQLLRLLYTGCVELIDGDIKKLNELCDLLGVPKNFNKRKLIFKQEKNLSSRKAEAKSRKKRIFTSNLDISDLTCDVCFKVFPKLYKLKNHQLIHQKSFPFICSDCGKGFKNKYKLNAHEKDHSKGLIKQSRKTVFKESLKVQKNYPCKHCGLIFTKATERNSHLEAVHKIVVNHSCNHCSSKFRTKKNLIAHLRVVHNDVEGNLRHVCTICDKRFPRPSHLEEHMARHNPVGQHPCMYCPKRCATKSDLDRHLASHKGENKHTCELCFKSFVHRSTYTVHVRRHLGQKPYVCRPCNKNFIQYKALKSHQKVHEKKNDRTVLVTPSKGSRGCHTYIDIIPEQPAIDNSIIVAKPKEMTTPSQVYLPGPQYNKSTGFKANQQSASAPLKQQFITDYAEISRIGYQFSDGDTDGFAAIVEMESLFDATNALDGTSVNILNEHI